MVGGTTLNSKRNDVSRLFLGVLLELRFQLVKSLRQLMLNLRLHARQQLVLCLFRGNSRNLLQLADMLSGLM